MCLYTMRLTCLYIAFQRNLKLEETLQRHGFPNAQWQKAVDARQYCSETLWGLCEQGLLSVRSYNTLTDKGQITSADIGSPGAVGCTLSHVECWKQCQPGSVVVVAEEDVAFTRRFSFDDLARLVNGREKNFMVRYTHFLKWGTHFYVCDYAACQTLLKYVFPINVQVDAFIHGFAKNNRIHTLEIGGVVLQTPHPSTIQSAKFWVRTFPGNVVVAVLPFCVALLCIGVLWYAHVKKLRRECGTENPEAPVPGDEK